MAVADLSKSEMIERLKETTKDAGGVTAWARAHDLHASVVSDVINGRRDIPESVANALGFFRAVVYRPARVERQAA